MVKEAIDGIQQIRIYMSLLFYICYNIKENKLILAKNINDYTHHVFVTKINLEDKINIEEEYTAYLSSPKITNNPKIIPYAFLQKY